MKHAELIARLEAAEVGSRGLNAELWDIEDDRPRHSLDGDFPTYKQDPEDSAAFDSPPPYTASLDAALALAERVLPGARIELVKFARVGACARLGIGASCGGYTPALALCIAILKALDNQ